MSYHDKSHEETAGPVRIAPSGTSADSFVKWKQSDNMGDSSTAQLHGKKSEESYDDDNANDFTEFSISASSSTTTTTSSTSTTSTSTSSTTYYLERPTTIIASSTSTASTSSSTYTSSTLPTIEPTIRLSRKPTVKPSAPPTVRPTTRPSRKPTKTPSTTPTVYPSKSPNDSPTMYPSISEDDMFGKEEIAVVTGNADDINTSRVASKVKIQLPEYVGENRIGLREVRVWAPYHYNAADRKPARQSSDWSNKTAASNAVDGDYQTYSDTNNEINAWWEVDLGSRTIIEGVQIKQWCEAEYDPEICMGRLSYATVSLIDEFDDVVATRNVGDTTGKDSIDVDFARLIPPYPENSPNVNTNAPSTREAAPTSSPTNLPTILLERAPTSSPYGDEYANKNDDMFAIEGIAIVTGNADDINTSRIARKVKIQLPEYVGENRIGLREVRVRDPYHYNAADRKPASQSSDWSVKTVASNAVDGDYQTYSDTNNEINAWWEVDLGSRTIIEGVEIKQWCEAEYDPEICMGRLSHATVSLIAETGDVVATRNLGDTTGIDSIDIDFSRLIPLDTEDSPVTNAPTTAAVDAAPNSSPTYNPTSSFEDEIVDPNDSFEEISGVNDGLDFDDDTEASDETIHDKTSPDQDLGNYTSPCGLYDTPTSFGSYPSENQGVILRYRYEVVQDLTGLEYDWTFNSRGEFVRDGTKYLVKSVLPEIEHEILEEVIPTLFDDCTKRKLRTSQHTTHSSNQTPSIVGINMKPDDFPLPQSECTSDYTPHDPLKLSQCHHIEGAMTLYFQETSPHNTFKQAVAIRTLNTIKEAMKNGSLLSSLDSVLSLTFLDISYSLSLITPATLPSIITKPTVKPPRPSYDASGADEDAMADSEDNFEVVSSIDEEQDYIEKTELVEASGDDKGVITDSDDYFEEVSSVDVEQDYINNAESATQTINHSGSYYQEIADNRTIPCGAHHQQLTASLESLSSKNRGEVLRYRYELVQDLTGLEMDWTINSKGEYIRDGTKYLVNSILPEVENKIMDEVMIPALFDSCRKRVLRKLASSGVVGINMKPDDFPLSQQDCTSDYTPRDPLRLSQCHHIEGAMTLYFRETSPYRTLTAAVTLQTLNAIREAMENGLLVSSLDSVLSLTFLNSSFAIDTITPMYVAEIDAPGDSSKIESSSGILAGIALVLLLFGILAFILAFIVWNYKYNVEHGHDKQWFQIPTWDALDESIMRDEDSNSSPTNNSDDTGTFAVIESSDDDSEDQDKVGKSESESLGHVDPIFEKANQVNWADDNSVTPRPTEATELQSESSAMTVKVKNTLIRFGLHDKVHDPVSKKSDSMKRVNWADHSSKPLHRSNTL